MATLNEFLFAGEVASSEAIYHLSQAISLVNRELGTAEALSNSNLAVVNFLIFQGLLQERKLTAEVHLKGLRKMVELRGGLSQLEEDSKLVLKICK